MELAYFGLFVDYFTYICVNSKLVDDNFSLFTSLIKARFNLLLSVHYFLGVVLHF